MVLRLEAERLRNLQPTALDLESGMTVILGENAQGKTSLLEAVYLLATGRSFRTRRIDDVVSWSGGPARVAGEIRGSGGRSRLAVTVEDGVRRLAADGAEQEIEAFLGRLDVVDLTAERMRVLRGSPQDRRRFLDRGVVGLRPSFLRELGRYRRTLVQRNALLRRGASAADGELETWDERLAAAAAPLHLERLAYVERLGRQVRAIGGELLPHGGRLTLHYRPSPAALGREPPAGLAAALLDAFRAARRRDAEVGHTTHGPHRDDLAIELDGVDQGRFGSAGQVRAAMIALKLAKLSLLHERGGEPPVFLMDDFDTDLDEVRASAVAGFLRAGGFQALVATSKETLVGRLGVGFGKLRVVGGQAEAG